MSNRLKWFVLSILLLELFHHQFYRSLLFFQELVQDVSELWRWHRLPLLEVFHLPSIRTTDTHRLSNLVLCSQLQLPVRMYSKNVRYIFKKSYKIFARYFLLDCCLVVLNTYLSCKLSGAHFIIDEKYETVKVFWSFVLHIWLIFAWREPQYRKPSFKTHLS